MCVCVQPRWPSSRIFFLERSDTCCFSPCLVLSFSHPLFLLDTNAHTLCFFWSVKQLVVSSFPLPSNAAFRAFTCMMKQNKTKKTSPSCQRKRELTFLSLCAVFNLTVKQQREIKMCSLSGWDQKKERSSTDFWPAGSLPWHFKALTHSCQGWFDSDSRETSGLALHECAHVRVCVWVCGSKI